MNLVLLGLLAQGGDPLLNICVVHVVHVAQDGHHETLQQLRFKYRLCTG